MKAVRLVEAHYPLQMQDIPVLTIGESDVMVRVRAVGICHSDVHYRAGKSPVQPLSRTLGHEIAGIVEQVGSRVTTVKVGQCVCVHYVLSCGECSYWPIRPAHGVYNAKLSISFTSQSRERDCLFLPALKGSCMTVVAPLVFLCRFFSSHKSFTLSILSAGPTGHYATTVQV
jgi:NADPH:quinone reductase-like Zn-dependent oxidoreductase